MAQTKKFQDLDLNNAFLFAAALEDEETCQLILELILGEKIGPVRVKTEHTILFSTDFRYVRLDVHAQDEIEVNYNAEMQNKDEKNLPKRTRYHQAELDISSLKPGEDFNALKPCIIIFICTFDPFGRNLYRYTFEERCIEANFPLGDETKKIFLSTKGTNDGNVPAKLIHFLNYVENSSEQCASATKDADIPKLQSDPLFYQEMMEKYGISER